MWIGGLENHKNAFWGQNFCYGKGSVTWGVVMMEHSFVCKVWSYAFSEPIKDIFINNSVHSLSWRKKFLVNFVFCQKTNQHWNQIHLLIWAFFGRGEFLVCHSSLCLLVSWSYSKIHDSSPVITRLNKSCSLVILSSRSRHLFIDAF